MSAEIDNKVVLVIGGGSGVGRDMCLLYAGGNAIVGVSDTDFACAEQVVSTIQARGGRALPIKHDPCNEESWDVAVQKLLFHYGRLDILVRSSGKCASSPRTEYRDEDDFSGPGIKRALIIMRESGGGELIDLHRRTITVGPETL